MDSENYYSKLYHFTRKKSRICATIVFFSANRRTKSVGQWSKNFAQLVLCALFGVKADSPEDDSHSFLPKREQNHASVFLQQKMHPIQQTLVLRAGFHNINPGCLDAGMPQHIGQFGQVLVQLIKGFGKQMPQIVGEYLLPRHLRTAAQRL